jgi:hypothetical protein
MNLGRSVFELTDSALDLSLRNAHKVYVHGESAGTARFMTERMNPESSPRRQWFKVLRWPIIVAAILIFGMLIRMLNGTFYPLSPDPKAAKTQLVLLIPHGTGLATATNRMNEMGFSCTAVPSQSFDDEASNRRYNGSFIRCVGKKSGLFGFPTYLWVIGLVHDENDRVTNVLVGISNRSLIIP